MAQHNDRAQEGLPQDTIDAHAEQDRRTALDTAPAPAPAPAKSKGKGKGTSGGDRT